ncbi:MAG: ferritin family protein [candidate division Zixibacteria bacterium]|nr:ferritin family protein [candidate division Zixibacteria bacterium]
MNAFEHAMKMEQDGRAFYLEHAGKTDNPALRRVLAELADDELKHYNIFKAMHDLEKAEYRESEKTTIVRTVKNVFEEMRSQNRNYAFAADARRIWDTAREVEKKSETFYREKAREMTDDNQKKIWNRIADEEQRHWHTIEQVIQFLDRPRQWLADAEWNSLEE